MVGNTFLEQKEVCNKALLGLLSSNASQSSGEEICPVSSKGPCGNTRQLIHQTDTGCGLFSELLPASEANYSKSLQCVTLQRLLFRSVAQRSFYSFYFYCRIHRHNRLNKISQHRHLVTRLAVKFQLFCTNEINFLLVALVQRLCVLHLLLEN